MTTYTISDFAFKTFVEPMLSECRSARMVQRGHLVDIVIDDPADEVVFVADFYEQYNAQRNDKTLINIFINVPDRLEYIGEMCMIMDSRKIYVQTSTGLVEVTV